MREILKKYVGEEIGINIERPFRIDPVKITFAGDDHFSVQDHDREYTHHFSYQSIAQIIENEGGIDIGGLFTHKKHFSVIVKIGHIVEYIPA